MDKKGLLAIPALVAFGVGAIALAANSNHNQDIFNGYATADKVLEITAQDIATAIGEGTSGNFNVGGLTWHVDNASSDGSTATINGGTLYNTTMAGTTINASGYRGNGFSQLEIVNKASASGINFETKDKNDTLITQRGLGAETQASYVVDFSSDNTPSRFVSKVFLAFGAGGGTSFSSIRFIYSCTLATPSAVLTANHESIEVGGTSQISANFTDVEGTPTLHSFVSSDEDVATVSNTGLVTGVAAGTTTITAKFTYNAVEYSATGIEIEVVAGVEYFDLTFLDTSNFEGAGCELFFANKGSEVGVDYPNLDSLDKTKVSIDLVFDGGTNYKGYEGALTKSYTPTAVTFPENNGRIYFTVPNGFPNNDDYTHTMKVTLEKTSTEIFEGEIVITGNKTVTSTSGSWHKA